MSAGLPVSLLINVNVNQAPPPGQFANLNSLLILGDSNVIDTTQRIRSYATLDEVAIDFGTTAPEYLAAALFFDQAPQPTLLYIGRWAQTATHGLLIGGIIAIANELITAWTPITTGAFFVSIDSIPLSINGLNFGATTNLNGVASVIQTALNAASAGSTCVWDSVTENFTISSGTTGPASLVSFLNAPTATGFMSFAGQPAVNDTVTFNGTAITFVAAGAVGNQVNIGGSTTATIQALQAFCAASADVQLVKFKYVAGTAKLYLYAAATGAGGNALTLAKSSVNITLSGGTLSGGSGVDVSGMLAGLATSSGAYSAPGVSAESAVAAVVILDNTGFYWYGLTVASPDVTDADHIAIANYVEGSNNKHTYGITSSEAGCLSSVSTTDIAYVTSAAKYNRTFVQYSSTTAYAAASFYGRALTVNFTQNNSTITLMYKQEPGVTPETLTPSQAAALQAKNANVFVNYNNNTAIIQYGTVASGLFFDSIYNADSFANAIQTNVYNLLYTSPTKIPQTDAGMNQILTVISQTCDQYVQDGYLGPGTWQSGGFGQITFGSYLPKGYYVYAPPLSSQSETARAARQSVPIQIAAKEAGAIQTVNITVLVNR